jgi:hypothetical protein
MMTPEQKYNSDAHYRMLTDAIEAQLHYAHFTPSEVRECALLAAIHFERRHFHRTVISQGLGNPFPEEVRRAMKTLEDWRVSNPISEFLKKVENGESD